MDNNLSDILEQISIRVLEKASRINLLNVLIPDGIQMKKNCFILCSDRLLMREEGPHFTTPLKMVSLKQPSCYYDIRIYQLFKETKMVKMPPT